MNPAAEQHLSAAASHIAVAESGDPKWSAYGKAADEILAAQAADPKLTQTEIARRLGKRQDWVSRLLVWHGDHRKTAPFSNVEAAQRYRERQVPTRHEDRVEMAAKLLADPDVAARAVEQALATPSKASRLIENTVAKKGAERRKKQVEATQRQREDGALPLPAYMTAMVLKMTEFEAGMKALEPDLGELPEGRARELVGETARRLGDTAYRWADLLERPVLKVIEGRKTG